VFGTLFPGQTLASARRNAIDVVLNACELRSGSAFRFGSRESHCYRYGTVVDDLPVALAVAASAAIRSCCRRSIASSPSATAAVRRRAVASFLTDGGVFDNLGTSVLEPGRDPGFTVTYDPAT
jgi:NTE family protein